MLLSLQEYGFAFADGPADLGMEDLGAMLGRVFRSPTKPTTQLLVPRTKDLARPNTYSELFGVGEFPMHTDLAHWHLPPRYIVLRCVIPDDQVATKVVSANEVLPAHTTTEARRALFTPRRRIKNQCYFLRVSEPHLSRWDSIFIQPANAAAQDLKLQIEERLQTIRPREFRFTEAGQMLIIDNWVVLHGRSAVPNASRGRAVERLYLESLHG